MFRLQGLIQIINFCRLSAFKCIGATFTVGVNARSVNQETRKVPGGPLGDVQDWFVQKKVVQVPNSGGSPLRVNP